MESLKEKTAKGLFWGGLNNGVQQFLGLVFGIILGRLLSPSDYGMMAMIAVFSLIAATLQDSGFKVAIANMKHVTDNDYNSVFWFNIIVSALMYVILFFASSFIADYYHTPELVPLCRYTFLGFVIASMGISPSAYLFRNLMVKQQAKCGMTAIVISSIAGVLLAWFGFSYWALATQGLVFVAVNTTMLWHYCKWRPSLKIDFTPVKHMFKFSCKILTTTIFTHINNNVLNILLGRYFTPRQVGDYNQAYQWNSKGYSLIQGMVYQVAQPVFANLNDEGVRQLRILRKMMRFTAFISFPLMFGLALVSHEFIIVAITEKWINSAVLLQLLCVSGAFVPLSTLLSNLIISKGNSNIYMWCTLALGLVQVILMISLYPYGIRTMVIAYVILNILWLPVWHFFVRRLVGYGFLAILKDILPFCIVAACVMGLTYFITSAIPNMKVLLISRIILAALLYYGVMKIAHVSILKECTEFIKSKIKY